MVMGFEDYYVYLGASYWHYAQIDTLTLDLDIDTMTLKEGILCVPGMYIILTQSTQHTKIQWPSEDV